MKKIILSGLVGDEITAANIRPQLNGAAGDDIGVHLSSIGGLVSAGLEIFNLFRDYRRDYPAARMTLSMKGEVASMASYLAVNPAFDLVAAEDNASGTTRGLITSRSRRAATPLRRLAVVSRATTLPCLSIATRPQSASASSR